ncbi:MAG: hypothetical protein J6T48_00600 [Bacteroidales bacterium]|nr:hypothetical protein [Bacteroidales bacterium]
MTHKLTTISLCIIALLVFVACNKENEIPADVEFATDKQYFPLQTDKALIYKVTEINIDKPSDYYDTAVYYLRERTDIPFIDNEGDTAYRIERFKSQTTSNWKISDVWEAKLTTYTAEKVEENQRFIKIKFPLVIGKYWNGNLKNELDDKDCTITSLSATYNNESIHLDSCLSITRDSSVTQISKQYDVEIYARGIGLVYKEITDINSQEVIYGVPIENRIHRGTIYRQELITIE